MISAPKTPAPDVIPANVSSNKLSTNQGGIVLPYFAGRRPLALNWAQSRVYNPRSTPVTQKVGKSNRTTGYNYFGDLFGVCSCVRSDYIEALEIAGTIVWSGFIERDADNPVFAPINLPDGSRWRYYWGNPDQPLDDLVLSTCGEEHPNYLDQSYLVGKDVPFGSNSTTPPSVRVFVERAPRFSGLDENRTREGASMITAMAELIGDDFVGLGLPGLVDVASWATQCTETKRETTIDLNGDSHAASMGYGSIFLDKPQTARAVFAQILEHFDGWIRPLGETLELGRFPHDGVVPSGLAELSYHDFISHPSFDSPADADAEPVTEVSCVFTDREYNHEDNSAVGFNVAARQRLGEPNRVTIRRPFLTTNYQAQEQAHEYAKFFARNEASATCDIRRERLNALREGDRFILNDAPSSYRAIVRITKRVDPGAGGIATVTLVEERGLAPLTFVMPANPTPYLPPPELVAIAHGRIFQLPIAFADYGPAPVVVPLCERPAAHVAGFSVHYSTSGSTYDLLSTVNRWAMRGTLVSGIDAAVTTLSLNASGFDLATLQSQSTAAQLDDTLLIVCGYEILSIGAVTALGGGQYSCAVLRGRRGSAAASHSGSAECYVIGRADLEYLQHANFPRDSSVRYFKLPTYTPSEEQELADALAITFTFDSAGVVAPSNFDADPVPFGIKLSWTNPRDRTIIMQEIVAQPAASPAPGDSTVATYQISGQDYTAPVAPGLTEYFYIRNRDTIGDFSTWTGPVHATASSGDAEVGDAIDEVRVLLDKLADDQARHVLATTDHVGIVLREIALRDETFTAIQEEHTNDIESLARDLSAMHLSRGDFWGTIFEEKTIRITERDATATITTALGIAVGDSSSGIIQELNVHADGISAISSDLEILTATVGDQTASVEILTEAYVVDGQAVATWGFKLDGAGKVVRMQAVAASGGDQDEVGVIAFSDCDLRSGDYVGTTAGWEIRADGSVDLNEGNFRGKVDIGDGLYNRTQIEGGVVKFGSSELLEIAGFSSAVILSAGNGAFTLAGLSGYANAEWGGGLAAINSYGDATFQDVTMEGELTLSGDLFLGVGGATRWIRDANNDRILRERFATTPATLAEVIALCQYHGFCN